MRHTSHCHACGTYTNTTPPVWIPEEEENLLTCRIVLYLHELADRDFANAVESVVVDRGELTLNVAREHVHEVAQALRDDPDLRFEVSLGVSGVHYPHETGRELQNPYQPTQARFNRGKLVFERVCASCHGREGDNNGSVIVARGAFAPTVLVSPVVRDMPDGRLFHVATFGGPTKMKGYGDLLSREDRWQVVLYIRELQKAAKPTAAPAPATGAQP